MLEVSLAPGACSVSPIETAHLLRGGFSSRPEIIPLTEFTTLGSDRGNRIVVNDPAVADRHARIERKETEFIIKDLRTSQGTYLNGVRVIEAYLRQGDHIRLGNTELVFQASGTHEEVPETLRSRNIEWNSQLASLPSFSKTQFNVLLLGESGTGKDVLARAIHQYSMRSRGPFVSVNCSALTGTLIESELFGHVKGSFTGANYDRKGAFEAARGGTLFLDEIGDFPIDLQPKLLRALENREIRPVGGDKIITTDVRIVAATHQDLHRRVSEQTFRADLFFRLNVIRLQVPALRNRLEDFEHLIFKFARDCRVRLTHNAIEELKKHNWPGNIRELKNLVSRASAIFPRDEIQPHHLIRMLDAVAAPNGLAPKSATGLTEGALPIIKEIERDMIKKRLIANRGNQRRTAHDLGMPKSTLHDRIRTYNIDIKDLLRDEAGS